MLSERPWKLEAVIVLLLAFFAAYVVGVVYWQGLQMGMGAGFQEQSYYDSLALTLLMDAVLISLVTLFLRYHERGWGWFLGFKTPRLAGNVMLALAVGVAVLPLALGLNKLCLWLLTLADHAPDAQAAIKMFHESDSLSRQIAFAFTAVVCAPIVEETLFRGILYPAIKEAGYPRIALWGTSFMFAAIHMNLMTLVPLTVLALVWVWLYEVTDTLLAPIVAHAVFNSINFAMLTFERELSDWGERVLRMFSGA